MQKTIEKIIIIMVIFISFSINSVAYEGFNIFTGESKELTLEESTKYMMEESSGAKEAKLNKKKTSNSIDINNNQIDAITNMSNTQVMNTRYDGLQAVLIKMKRDFYKTQKYDDYEEAMNELKYGLREKYFRTLQAKDAYEIKKEALEISKTNLLELEKKFELGLINELDLEEAKISKENAEISLLDADKALSLSKLDLNNYMGYDMYTNLILLDKLEEVKISEKSVKDTLYLALKNNNQMKKINFFAKLKDRELEGLALRVSTGSTSYVQCKLEAQSARAQESDLKKGLEISANAKYMTMIIKKYYVDLAKKDLAYAQRQSDAAKLSYDLGLAVYLDLKKANTNLEAKKLELSSKILEYNLSVDDYELLSTVGRNAPMAAAGVN